ncbi:hypothetical protein LFU01_36410 [Lysinibacillus fusiformis]|nr:hypothetical protein LFU01_36410 [Lysinibacillus fusiformis]
MGPPLKTAELIFFYFSYYEMPPNYIIRNGNLSNIWGCINFIIAWDFFMHFLAE